VNEFASVNLCVNNRVAIHLENVEKFENLKMIGKKNYGKLEKSRNMCSCLWCVTMCYVVDTK